MVKCFKVLLRFVLHLLVPNDVVRLQLTSVNFTFSITISSLGVCSRLFNFYKITSLFLSKLRQNPAIGKTVRNTRVLSTWQFTHKCLTKRTRGFLHKKNKAYLVRINAPLHTAAMLPHRDAVYTNHVILGSSSWCKQKHAFWLHHPSCVRVHYYPGGGVGWATINCFILQASFPITI